MFDNLRDKPEIISVQVQQIKDKIKAKETEVGNPISYVVGTGDHEIVILSQPLEQNAVIEWETGKMREVKRRRFIAVGKFGVGAIDFVNAVKYDDTDNNSEPDKSQVYGMSPKHIYPKEGEWVENIEQGINATGGHSENSMLRNLREGSSGTTVEMQGLILDLPKPHISIRGDFGASIHTDVQPTEFTDALKLSIEKSKPVEIKVDVGTQTGLMSAILSQF